MWEAFGEVTAPGQPRTPDESTAVRNARLLVSEDTRGRRSARYRATRGQESPSCMGVGGMRGAGAGRPPGQGAGISRRRAHGTSAGMHERGSWPRRRTPAAAPRALGACAHKRRAACTRDACGTVSLGHGREGAVGVGSRTARDAPDQGGKAHRARQDDAGRGNQAAQSPAGRRLAVTSTRRGTSSSRNGSRQPHRPQQRVPTSQGPMPAVP